MSNTRLLRVSRPLGLCPSRDFKFSACQTMVSRSSMLICLSKAGLNSGTGLNGGGERKPVVVKAGDSACLAVSESKIDKRADLSLLVTYVSDAISWWMKLIVKHRPWRLNIQIFIEKLIIDCRFFTMLAIGGSLLGSVLCFAEGCFMILESYFQYFHTLSQLSKQGHVVQLLLEAIDMFLIGTTMIIFGMALYVMFVGSRNLETKGSRYLAPNLGMQSVMQAKSKVGHALLIILQVQVLEKIKSIPLATSLDLACLAGAIFISSISVFVLSRLSIGHAQTPQTSVSVKRFTEHT